MIADRFMPKMHLRQPVFTYSASGPFTKSKEKIQKFKETQDWRYIYQNDPDKDFKDLSKRTASDKVLHDKAFNIAKGPK